MATNMPRVGSLIVEIFRASREMQPSLAQKWVTASHRAGSRIPESLISESIQRVGELDAVCCAIEDELHLLPPKDGEMDFRFHYLAFLADLWVGAAYAVCYAFASRKIFPGDQEFDALAEDLRLVRVQTEKYEIPSDRKLDAPIEMVTAPGQPGSPRRFRYDKTDPQRAHIGRIGMSDRRSPMWEVIDLNTNTMRWLERRALAERLLDVLAK
ncbi:hypothetical protein EDE08_109349 [Bradyrhizobium sp. R2.2-H]|nr:hypothetical protein EDE10_10964 [Bradyrhizobium sp. Y-H1]TCU70124.1 hypothetical protein EDE08_109349 [Bradyrhizobium sp. R2.2-H]